MISLPQKINLVSEEGSKAVFEIEGLYPGYGQTIGNSLRRVLLSSLKGAAITSVKIEGVQHEFSTIEGVMEDVVEIILNLKQFRFRLHEEGPFTITLSAKGERDVTGADFKTPSQVELINKDTPVATLSSKKSNLNIEATVESGLGYVPVESRSKDKVEVGTIAMDAAFSPVRHVNYEVENMRVGDRTDYNKLRLTIETDGSLMPLEALTEAAKTLEGQFHIIGEGVSEDRPLGGIMARSAERAPVEEKDEDENETTKMKIEDLGISNRTQNALREAGIKTVGGLSRKKESALRETEGLGEKGISEIKTALSGLGLSLKE
jgi:DNA-directed RNA polymerase subunit alpha